MEIKIKKALIKMGPRYLKPEYRQKWSLERPTAGFCYVVSEALYHLYPNQYTPFFIKTKEGTHWFLKDKNGNIVDYTADQFDKPLNYEKARKGAFLTKKISARAKKLKEILNE